MRLRHILTLSSLSLALACHDGKSGLDTLSNLADGDASTGTVRVRVVSAGSDSSFTRIPGARVILLNVGTIPPDTIPDSIPGPPPPPPPPVESLTAGIFGDTVVPPPDSTPPPPPPDSTPPDSTPPPPPPPGCGRSGTPVARGVTNAEGAVIFTGLASAKYDILVEVPGTDRQGAFCGVHLLSGQTATIQVVVH